jgi:hypothetical protein
MPSHDRVALGALVEAESVDVKESILRDLPPHYPDAHLAVDLPITASFFFTHVDPATRLSTGPRRRQTGGGTDVLGFGVG